MVPSNDTLERSVRGSIERAASARTTIAPAACRNGLARPAQRGRWAACCAMRNTLYLAGDTVDSPQGAAALLPGRQPRRHPAEACEAIADATYCSGVRPGDWRYGRSWIQAASA